MPAAWRCQRKSTPINKHNCQHNKNTKLPRTTTTTDTTVTQSQPNISKFLRTPPPTERWAWQTDSQTVRQTVWHFCICRVNFRWKVFGVGISLNLSLTWTFSQSPNCHKHEIWLLTRFTSSHRLKFYLHTFVWKSPRIFSNKFRF